MAGSLRNALNLSTSRTHTNVGCATGIDDRSGDDDDYDEADDQDEIGQARVVSVSLDSNQWRQAQKSQCLFALVRDLFALLMVSDRNPDLARLCWL